MKYTINQFRKEYPNDEVCLDAIFKMRYSAMPCCPQCQQTTTFKRIPGRRAYQCGDKDCQYQLYPTAGTVFEKTRVSLVNWFYVIYLMTSTRNGVSGKEIQRQLGVTYKCAWRMGHQIRLLMDSGNSILSGVVEVDETYIGGKNEFKHKKVREELNKKGTGYVNKTPLLAMLQRDGQIVTKVLTEATSETIRPLMKDHIKGGSTVVTDGFGAYRALKHTHEHEVVNHANDEFVRGLFHTNTVEGFFSHLKRTIKGTHIHVSVKYLQRYSNECAFRYTHRKEGQLMFKTILNRVVV